MISHIADWLLIHILQEILISTVYAQLGMCCETRFCIAGSSTSESLRDVGEPRNPWFYIHKFGGFLSHGGTPIAGWFIMEDSMKMDDN